MVFSQHHGTAEKKNLGVPQILEVQVDYWARLAAWVLVFYGHACVLHGLYYEEDAHDEEDHHDVEDLHEEVDFHGDEDLHDEVALHDEVGLHDEAGLYDVEDL